MASSFISLFNILIEISNFQGDWGLEIRSNGIRQAFSMDIHRSCPRGYSWYHFASANTLWWQRTVRRQAFGNWSCHRSTNVGCEQRLVFLFIFKKLLKIDNYIKKFRITELMYKKWINYSCNVVINKSIVNILMKSFNYLVLFSTCNSME